MSGPYFWGNKLLFVDGQVAMHDNCCCICSGCCGGKGEPARFKMKVGAGSFSGGEFMEIPDCDCCDCKQMGLPEMPVTLERRGAEEDCLWDSIETFLCCDSYLSNVGPCVVQLFLESEIINGVCKVSALVLYDDLIWETDDFDCHADEDNPNILTTTDSGDCDTVPNEVHIWRPGPYDE